MPTANVNASSVMMLSVKPNAHIRPKVAIIEAGIDNAAINGGAPVEQKYQYH